jgi:hypothetical protein
MLHSAAPLRLSGVLGWLALTAQCVSGSGCAREDEPAASVLPYKAIERTVFNRRAAELFLPLFWREDTNANGNLEPDELAILKGYGEDDRDKWIDAAGVFRPAFSEAYKQMLDPDPPTQDPKEQARHRSVLTELAQGRPTLVETDLRQASEAEKNLIAHIVQARKLIERLYARQKGVLGMEEKIAPGDLASRMLLYRNQSPFCEAPKTQSDPDCNALTVRPPAIVGLYPPDIQENRQFCDMLAKNPNAAALTGHFSIVTKDEKTGALRALPYSEAYREDMEGVAKELEAAAEKLGDDESALKRYLKTAATSFRSNDWEPANAAWVAMNAQNSKWYLRVAPDEVYYDPCALKAGFALQFARINPDSIEWQKKLDPLKGEMEKTLAAMAGAPYVARDVKFKIPDFIDVILNGGDQRKASGATIGQSLPNWGSVAEKGGRTTAMTNLYTDADSRAASAMQMSSMFCKATNALATTTPKESLITSLLHEAAHNLGPSHEYKVKGRVDDEVFGGPLASTLEELKAQTTSMFLTQWLAGKGLFTDEEVRKIQLRNVAWTFGHISRGMYAGNGTPRNYSQLAAMQLGSFVRAGAIVWRADEVAANGTDRGCLEIDFEKLAVAVNAFEARVLKIKASGDKRDAEKLKAEFVDAKDDFATLRDTIAERYLRAPKATFVYSVYW